MNSWRPNTLPRAARAGAWSGKIDLHQVPDVQNPDVALGYNRRAGRRSAQPYREAPISENPASTKAGLHGLTLGRRYTSSLVVLF